MLAFPRTPILEREKRKMQLGGVPQELEHDEETKYLLPESVRIGIFILSGCMLLSYHGYHGVFKTWYKRSELELLMHQKTARWVKIMMASTENSITAAQMTRNVMGVHNLLLALTALGGGMMAMTLRKQETVLRWEVTIDTILFMFAVICFALCTRFIHHAAFEVNLFPTEFPGKDRFSTSRKWTAHNWGLISGGKRHPIQVLPLQSKHVEVSVLEGASGLSYIIETKRKDGAVSNASFQIGSSRQVSSIVFNEGNGTATNAGDGSPSNDRDDSDDTSLSSSPPNLAATVPDLHPGGPLDARKSVPPPATSSAFAGKESPAAQTVPDYCAVVINCTEIQQTLKWILDRSDRRMKKNAAGSAGSGSASPVSTPDQRTPDSKNLGTPRSAATATPKPSAVRGVSLDAAMVTDRLYVPGLAAVGKAYPLATRPIMISSEEQCQIRDVALRRNVTQGGKFQVLRESERTFSVGNALLITAFLFETPSKDIIMYHVTHVDEEELSLLFVGDGLHIGQFGDAFEGDSERIAAVAKRLARLPPNTIILPGHSYGAKGLKLVRDVLWGDTIRGSLVENERQYAQFVDDLKLAYNQKGKPFPGESDYDAYIDAVEAKEGKEKSIFTPCLDQEFSFNPLLKLAREENCDKIQLRHLHDGIRSAASSFNRAHLEAMVCDQYRRLLHVSIIGTRTMYVALTFLFSVFGSYSLMAATIVSCFLCYRGVDGDRYGRPLVMPPPEPEAVVTGGSDLPVINEPTKEKKKTDDDTKSLKANAHQI